MDRMLRALDLGVTKTGDAGMLREQMEGVIVAGDRSGTEMPSGVLVGVSPGPGYHRVTLHRVAAP